MHILVIGSYILTVPIFACLVTRGGHIYSIFWLQIEQRFTFRITQQMATRLLDGRTHNLRLGKSNLGKCRK